MEDEEEEDVEERSSRRWERTRKDNMVGRTEENNAEIPPQIDGGERREEQLFAGGDGGKG